MLFHVNGRGETKEQRSIVSFDVHFELSVHVALTFAQKHSPSPAAITLLYVFLLLFTSHILETGGHRCRYCFFYWILNFMSEIWTRPMLVLSQSFQVEFLLHPMNMQRKSEKYLFRFVVVVAAVQLFSPHLECYPFGIVNVFCSIRRSMYFSRALFICCMNSRNTNCSFEQWSDSRKKRWRK